MIGTPAFGSTGIDAFAVAERLGQVVGGGATYTGGHTGSAM